LIDVLDPWESASVAWWLHRATKCCQDIAKRGKKVLFVGGTGLFLKALVYGLFDGPVSDETIRRDLESECKNQGSSFLHDRLKAVDPASARRLHANDAKRIIRALEVWQQTGRPISVWQQEWKAKAEPASCGTGGMRLFYLDIPRQELYQRMNTRVCRMVESGWGEEAKALRKLEFPLSKQALQALGYKEMFAYLEGRTSLEKAVGQIQMRSRQFAKRQLTWFRNFPGCKAASEDNIKAELG
jgi:tRNA dimethylallyltransferase